MTQAITNVLAAIVNFFAFTKNETIRSAKNIKSGNGTIVDYLFFPVYYFFIIAVLALLSIPVLALTGIITIK